jgi:hypothetical protein
MPYTLPQVSINGTSRAELITQQDAIVKACEVLAQALIQARPHGRDYQYRPGELQSAQAESNSDYRALDAISERANAILYALWEAGR